MSTQTELKKTFKVGDKVAVTVDADGEFSKKIVYNGSNSIQYGEVVEVISKTKIKVKWDTYYYNEVNYDAKTGTYGEYIPIEMNVKSVLPVKVAKAQFSALEKEYKLVEKEIKNKVKSAAKLIKEANSMSKKVGQNLSSMYNAIDPLYAVMDMAGWQTSSFNC